ncbi:MAG: hypothetical protein E7637_02285 [Ruminococcaceae bacterium]|nr:hypothetical protein [Oscillospiraceae bacterium]
MKLEKTERRRVVREGYQILLRAEAELWVPCGKEKIKRFYETMADTCMKWAETIYGERLRGEFLNLETLRERSHFHTQCYRFSMRSPWLEGKWAALLCESTLTGQWKQPESRYHRVSHVWNVEEEQLLPFSQILENFGMNVEKNQLPFRPDGIYPEGNEMVFFRNADESSRFLERRFPRQTGEPQ